MLLNRGLFLATLVSAVSVVFADIFVQPDFAYHYDVAQPNNVQPVSDFCIVPATEQLYQPDQTVAQPLLQPGVGYVQVSHPDYWSPNFLSRSHASYTKIGGHGYTRPTVIIKYPKSAHRRYRRSTATTSTMESSKSAINAYDDVAEKSALIGGKLPLNGLLLLKNQLTDTNNKHVTSRQISNDHAATSSGKLHRYSQAESPDKIQQLFFQSLLVSPNTPKQSDEQLSESIIKPVVVEQQAQPTIPQGEQLDQQNAYQKSDSKLLQEKRHVVGTRSPTEDVRHTSDKQTIYIRKMGLYPSLPYDQFPIADHIPDEYNNEWRYRRNLEKRHVIGTGDDTWDKRETKTIYLRRMPHPLLPISEESDLTAYSNPMSPVSDQPVLRSGHQTIIIRKVHPSPPTSDQSDSTSDYNPIFPMSDQPVLRSGHQTIIMRKVHPSPPTSDQSDSTSNYNPIFPISDQPVLRSGRRNTITIRQVHPSSPTSD